MSTIDDLKKAYNFSNYSRTIKNQIELLKLEKTKRLRFAHAGGLFELTPQFIMYVKAYADQGIYQGVFEDINDTPIKIEDIETIFQDMLETERTVLNWYFTEYEKIRKMRNLTDMIDTSVHD